MVARTQLRVEAATKRVKRAPAKAPKQAAAGAQPPRPPPRALPPRARGPGDAAAGGPGQPGPGPRGRPRGRAARAPAPAGVRTPPPASRPRPRPPAPPCSRPCGRHEAGTRRSASSPYLMTRVPPPAPSGCGGVADPAASPASRASLALSRLQAAASTSGGS